MTIPNAERLRELRDHWALMSDERGTIGVALLDSHLAGADDVGHLIKSMHCLALELPEKVWRDACLPVIDYLQRQEPTPPPAADKPKCATCNDRKRVLEPMDQCARNPVKPDEIVRVQQFVPCPDCAPPPAADIKHEQRVVGHVSGWREYMPTCVCGKPWPCDAAPPPAADNRMPRGGPSSEGAHAGAATGETGDDRPAAPSSTPQPASQALLSDDQKDALRAAISTFEQQIIRYFPTGTDGEKNRTRWIDALRAISALSARETQPSDELKAAMRECAQFVLANIDVMLPPAGSQPELHAEMSAHAHLLEAAAGAP